VPQPSRQVVDLGMAGGWLLGTTVPRERQGPPIGPAAAGVAAPAGIPSTDARSLTQDIS